MRFRSKTHCSGVIKLLNQKSIANYVVYCHTSPSGKKYIGQTNNYEKRCRQHRIWSNKCTAFARAINLYGWDAFSHEILKENLTIDEANYWEKILIKDIGTLSPNGYNLRDGGNASLFSEESKQKLSKNCHARGKFGIDNNTSKEYIVITPKGSYLIIKGICNYCKNNDLSAASMINVSNKKQPHHRGYFCEQYNKNIHTTERLIDMSSEWVLIIGKYRRTHKKGDNNSISKSYFVVSPSGDEFIIKGINNFCSENGLNSANMIQVAKGMKKNYKGWICGYDNQDTRKRLHDIYKSRIGIESHGNSKKFVAITPGGIAEIVNSLAKYCSDNSLSYSAALASASGRFTNHKKYYFSHYNEIIHTTEKIEDMASEWALKMNSYNKCGIGENNSCAKTYKLTSPGGIEFIVK